MVSPFLTLVVPWIAWKYAYYGRVLPNSYYVKVVGGGFNLVNGLTYVCRFLHWYLIWPVLILAGGLAVLRRRRAPEMTWIPSAMSNRLFTPVLTRRM